MSTHEIKVVKISVLENHPNADNLLLTKIWDYTCAIRKGQFNVGDLAAYISPDYIVSLERPEFAFLQKPGKNEKQLRIRAMKLRGIYSQGLLVPAPIGSQEGDNVMDQLEITRWEPPIETALCGAMTEIGPEIIAPKYDLENLKRYNTIITEGEEVVYTSKIHGCVQRTAKIKTPTGFTEIRKIKKDDIILGFCHKENKIIQTKVLKVFKNNKTDIWVKLKTKRIRNSNNPMSGNGFISFKLTPNHKIFSITRNDYIPVVDLQPQEEVKQIAYETNLTNLQKQILIGKMFGDGCYKKSSDISGYVYISHSKKDESYADYCAKILNPIIGSSRWLTSGYGSKIKSYKTKSMREINNLFCDWRIKKKKEIPKNIINQVTPLTLAFWYMDDGSLGHSKFQKDRALFATCNFNKTSCKILQKCLKKFGIKSVLYSSINKGNTTKHNRLRLNTIDAYKFFKLVGPYIHPSMRRKLPVEMRNIPFIEINDNEQNETKLKTFAVKIISNSLYREKHNYCRYDIETETHNYFAHDILIHNSNTKFIYQNNRMYCGSRTQWKRAPGPFLNSNNETIDVPMSAWWAALRDNPWVTEWCKQNPNIVLYGEIFGPNVQAGFHYGIKPGTYGFVVFDILKKNEFGSIEWINNFEFEANKQGNSSNPKYELLKFAPVLYRGPHDISVIEKLAEENETFNNASFNPGFGNKAHIREGIVVKVKNERYNSEIGRVALKYVSNNYLINS